MFTGFGKKLEGMKKKILNQESSEDRRIAAAEPPLSAEEQAAADLIKKEIGKRRALSNEQLKKEIFSGRGTEYTHSRDHEKILSSNKLEKRSGSLGGAMGSSSLIKLEDDGYGVFKSYEESDFEFRKRQIQSERAAYLVDLFLDLNLVPPTVARVFPDPEYESEQVGSMQQYIEDSKTGYQMTNHEKMSISADDATTMAIFDLIIQNTDRHGGNYLVKDERLHAIDHGMAFMSRFTRDEMIDRVLDPTIKYIDRVGPISEKEIWELKIPDGLFTKLMSFKESKKDQAILSRLLSEMIGEYRSEIYMTRIKVILDSIETNQILNPRIFSEGMDEQRKKYFPAIAA